MPYSVDDFIAAANDMQALCQEYAGMPTSQTDWDGVVARIGVATSALQTAVTQTQTRASQRPYPPSPASQAEPTIPEPAPLPEPPKANKRK